MRNSKHHSVDIGYNMTPLDKAHSLMENNADDASLRLGFYERLADSEMFLLLEEEPNGDRFKPMIFELEGGSFALIFDRSDRLVEFSETPSPFIALSGRVIVSLLHGKGIGLGINLTVASSSMLLPKENVDWLEETLSMRPKEVNEQLVGASAPVHLPEVLIKSIDMKLAMMQGLAKRAYLGEIEYASGIKSHVIAFVDALPEAENSIAAAISEALIFSGVAAGTLDVLFINSSDKICTILEKVGLRFDLPEVIMAKAYHYSK